jgi:hypothetical protein
MKAISTTRNLEKMSRVHEPAGEQVHQIRGKGMNIGGSDPRASNNVKPISQPRMPSGQAQSYLPAMKNGGVVPGVPHHGKGC